MKTKIKTFTVAITLICTFAHLHIRTFAQVANGTGAGNCLNFDGTDDYVDIPDANILDINNELTISVWVKPTFPKDQRTITKWGTAGFRSYNLDISSSGKVVFYTSSNGSDYYSRNTNDGAVVLNEWNYITLTYKGGSFQRIYVNGIQKDNGSGGTESLPVSIYSSVSPLRLARNLNDSPTGYFFQGLLDEIAIWNRALTETEIRDNMCKKLTGSESGLVGYWRFDEGSGSTVYDATTNGNDGTLY